IYAPMTKVVAESLEPIHATRCGVCYTFAMFFGSPLAGMLAAYFSWQDVFAISGAALGIMAISCFSIFTLFEKKGIIKRINRVDIEKNSGSIRTLFEHKIVKFTLVAMITGVIRTTVIFWLPMYIEEYLGFPEKNALLIFSIATFMLSLAAFVALFVYEKLKRNIDNSILVFFIVSAIMFALVYFVKQPLFNMIFIILAIMTSNGAASILWSMYCPSLRETGMVSSATGFLDFMSYISAAISSTIFANAVDSIGWKNLILVWFGLLSFGVIIALPFKSIYKKRAL
ncbi:MAG: MFS transporter, partial [Clostridia bacterium]|nr:MFS transporter [Clostridia bacterium]